MRKRKTKDKKIRNILLNQKGMALLTTLIFVFLLVTFGVSLLRMTSNDIKLSTLQRDSTKAFYIAEAGIEKALWNLNNDPSYSGESEGFGEGRYEVTVVQLTPPVPTLILAVEDRFKITSTGVVEGGTFSSGKRKIEVEAEVVTIATLVEPIEPAKYKKISWREVY